MVLEVFYVSVGNEVSSIKESWYGIKRGCILGPVLGLKKSLLIPNIFKGYHKLLVSEQKILLFGRWGLGGVI